VLPPSCTKRISIEAGVTALWWKYVGAEGKVLGTDKFGMSAPGDVVMEEFGMTAPALKKEVEALLKA
jgi:transketolase